MKKVKISVCYCDIPLEKLIALAHKRFVEGESTQSLMEQLDSEKDREYLATIALFDVKEEALCNMVEADPDRLRHFLDCRRHTEVILQSHGLVIKEH
ncbi:MAG: hypothetical protein HY582_00375 [Candidatus Omnitrophica bacterium]|nr:hypothetical protein [Candidatus Omnitrophota bacterium]